MRRNPYNSDRMKPSQRELEAARTSQSAQQTGQTWGSGIGGALGAGIGALGFLGGPAVGVPTTGLGLGVGSALGGALGGVIGGGYADGADQVLEEEERKRQEQLAELEYRRAALQHLSGMR